MAIQQIVRQLDVMACRNSHSRLHGACSLACVLILAVLLAGCFGRTAGGTAITRRQDLQKLPEEHLFYPGSTVIDQIGGDMDRFVAAGPNPAFSGYVLGVNVPEDGVFEFYRQQLPARGWQYSPIDIVNGTGEGRTLAWRKGQLVFSVTILLKDDPRNPKAGDAFVTPYVIRVTAEPPR